MTLKNRWSLAGLASVSLASAAFVLAVRPQASDAAAVPTPEPMAQVRTQVPQERSLPDTLEAVGDVLPGQTEGLNFPRAGQLTALKLLPGDHVAKGAVVAMLSVDPAAQETYQQAVSAAATARREADRVRQLLGLQLATQSQVDTADKAAQDAAGALKALQAQGGSASDAVLRAPFDGVVVNVAAAQGDRIAAGAPIAQLAHADALRVQIGIDPSRRTLLRPGLPVTLSTASADGQGPAPITTQLASVQNMVDPKTQLVSAMAVLPAQASTALVPGMKVSATIQLNARTALAVPRDAVLSDDHGAYVFQVSQGMAHRVAVQTRFESAGYAAITGLADIRLPVVTQGNYELRDGMAVKEVH